MDFWYIAYTWVCGSLYKSSWRFVTLTKQQKLQLHFKKTNKKISHVTGKGYKYCFLWMVSFLTFSGPFLTWVDNKAIIMYNIHKMSVWKH